MNIKKSKIVLALGGLLFLSVPLSSAFADEKHHEIQEMQLGDIMKSMKSELRGYVKGVKADDSQMMQQHLDELLQLSEKAAKESPAKINAMHTGGKMDHSKMDHDGMVMPEVEHSQMDMKDMSAMDHTKMNHGDMNTDRADHDMSTMPSMEGMSNEQHHQHMMYMQGAIKLQESFKQLAKTEDKSEIKAILGDIKEHIKKNRLFRQDSNRSGKESI